MRRRKRITNRRRSGFTLLEVLLVVGIIALLAAAVVPQFIKTGEKARLDKARSDVAWGGTIAGQIALFHQHVGRYPEELKELYEELEDEEEQEKWAGAYITDLNSLKDPWGSEFQYAAGDDAEHNPDRYDLWSMGKDKEDGTDDDIGNWNVED